eukprot:TRINITY_DN41839_c0_g1_i1.p1 TRINITY_DN41839_c0_g1~~TRINITY_DN41839_c0_g1_i1.p1  ORF type:complete len:122 (+),score=60.48 TRINITY_DN41839_c0_g1_i1:51-368(+)
MEQMNMALQCRWADEQEAPPVASLVGDRNEFTQSFVQRLVQRTGRVVFLSYNLKENQPHLEMFVQKQVIDQLKHMGVIESKGKGDKKKPIPNAAAAKSTSSLAAT